jgi:cysteine desulfurase
MLGKKRILHKLRSKRNIHLDFAGTTPVDKKVFKKMKKYFCDDFYNPSSIYFEAKKVKDTIENYRKQIAQKLQVKPHEIIFTNGGTESINMAIIGIIKKALKNTIEKLNVISTKIEHPAVLESLNEVEKNGAEIILLDVRESGLINIEDFCKNLNENTKLVTIGYVNSELGVIQNISRIGREIIKFKNKIGRNENDFPYFHVDASQAALTLDLNVDRLKVDLMTLDGSKIYGPKGTGCLIKKDHVKISSMFFGGGQEFNLRAGTENVSGIVGFCESILLTFDRKEKDKNHFSKLQNYMIEKLHKEIPEAQISGSIDDRIKNNINICIKGINSEFAVIMMDELGVNCSAMTACKSMKGDGRSYVIESVSGLDCSGSSIRFSFGRETKRKDIDKAVKYLRRTVDFQLKK